MSSYPSCLWACSWLALPHGAAPMARRNGTLSEPSSTRIARHSPAMTSGSHRSADSGRLTITIPQEERAAATGPQANGRSYSTSRAAGGLSQDAWASIAPTRPLSPGLQTRSSETCLGVPPRRRHSRRSATRRPTQGTATSQVNIVGNRTTERAESPAMASRSPARTTMAGVGSQAEEGELGRGRQHPSKDRQRRRSRPSLPAQRTCLDGSLRRRPIRGGGGSETPPSLS